MELLDCPICIETISGKLIQCINGHTFCESCIDGITGKITVGIYPCPVCRVSMSNRRRIRNMLVEKLIKSYEIKPKASVGMSKDSSSKSGNHNLIPSGPVLKSVNTAPNAEEVAVSGDLYLFTNKKGKKQIWQREDKEDVLTKIRFHDINHDGKVYVQLSAAKVWNTVQQAKPVNVGFETYSDKEKNTLKTEVQALVDTKKKLEAEIHELKNKKRKANEYNRELQLQKDSHDNNKKKKKKKPNNAGSKRTQVKNRAQIATEIFKNVNNQHIERGGRKTWTQQDKERLWVLYKRFTNDADKWEKLVDNFSPRSKEAIQKQIRVIKKAQNGTLWSNEDKQLLWKTYTNLKHDKNKWGKLLKKIVGRTKNAMMWQISILRQRNGNRSGSALHGENTGRWTKEEHRIFLLGLEKHGKEWNKISYMIPTRSVAQIKTHAQKYFQKEAKVANREGSESSSGEGSESSSSSSSKGNNELEKNSSAKWDVGDKQLLWQLYKKFGKNDNDKWGKIATMFPGRSELALQVQIKNIMKAGSGAKWNVLDKQLLWQRYKKLENDDDKWRKIAALFPGRSELALQVQIAGLRRQKKAAHKQTIRQQKASKKNSKWDVGDKQLLWQLYKKFENDDDKWVKVRTRFPGRSELALQVQIANLRRQKKAAHKQTKPNTNHGNHKLRQPNNVNRNIQSTDSIHGIPFIKGTFTYNPAEDTSILTAEWAWDQNQLESKRLYAKNSCLYIGKGKRPKSMMGSFNMYTEVGVQTSSVAAPTEYRNLAYEEKFDNLTYVTQKSSCNKESNNNNTQIKITGNGFNNFGKFAIKGTLNEISNQNNNEIQEWQIVLQKQYKTA
jgi:SHAQKYF class myb-like DNA-binding protein